VKVLVALSRFPYPTDKGDRLRAYYQIKHLHRHHEVYVVCLTDKEPAPEHRSHMAQYCKELYVIKHTKVQGILSVGKSFFNGLPHQVNYFHCPAMKASMEQLIKKHRIDVCFVQLIRLGRNIPFEAPCKFFLDYMDSFSSNFRKRAPLSKWYEQPVVEQEAERLTRYETEIASKFDAYSIISWADREKFDRVLAEQLQVIPNGVGERFLKHNTNKAEKTKKYDLLFTGNMGYHPNVQACLFLVNKILPITEKKLGELKVCLAGTTPTASVLALENHRAVTVTGYVPDLRDCMITSRMFVAPLFSGAGLQNKLLEAMAMGMPVLTSPDTNEALRAQAGRDLLICRNEKEFADGIEQLLKHPNEAKKMGLAGRKFVQENYDWEASNRKLEQSLLGLVNSAGQA
jgi:sugar transferase (PEP-CTERM/EpsH1 system associated)